MLFSRFLPILILPESQVHLGQWIWTSHSQLYLKVDCICRLLWKSHTAQKQIILPLKKCDFPESLKSTSWLQRFWKNLTSLSVNPLGQPGTALNSSGSQLSYKHQNYSILTFEERHTTSYSLYIIHNSIVKLKAWHYNLIAHQSQNKLLTIHHDEPTAWLTFGLLELLLCGLNIYKYHIQIASRAFPSYEQNLQFNHLNY